MAQDVRLIRSPISILGMVLTTISAVLFLIVFLADLFGLHSNPYLGIVFFLVLPGLFLFGLLLIPLGAWVERRRRAAGRAPTEIRWPSLDLNNPVQRQRAVFIFALTLANVVIVSLAAYRGVEYMDSVQFCGQVCHTVMKPEFVAYQDGAHSRVACVQCHIGSGASWFARSKISGTRQVIAVLRHSYSTPIPSPVQNLRPARDTCEQCHWPEKFHGDIVRRVVEYADDEKNGESVTTLRVHVGGASERRGVATGIHWHVATEVEYLATDTQREVIPYVRVVDRNGGVREYFAENVTPAQLAKGERRRMDCVDCHNRPSHPLAATPERAVNEAMASGELPKTLPFIHREATKALKVSYTSEAVALREISNALGIFYRAREPQAPAERAQAVGKAVSAVQEIYRRNVFPEMGVRFGTHPNNIGHVDSPGCFRCHDDSHKTRDGRKIPQDCDTCHAIE